MTNVGSRQGWYESMCCSRRPSGLESRDVVAYISNQFFQQIKCVSADTSLNDHFEDVLRPFVWFLDPMPAQPELPRPAHIDHDSMLSRKFGKEITNYFGSMKLRRRL